MNDILRLIIVMEMVIANLYTAHTCAAKKYSSLICTAVLGGFTVVLTFFTHDIWTIIGFDRGNAVFALIGVVYLVPLTYLYKEKLYHLVSILFSTWIYTLIIFCLSTHFGALLLPDELLKGICIIQSILYVFTFYIFNFWIKKGFLFILSNINKETLLLLQIVSVWWYFSIIIFNANLIYDNRKLLQIAAVIMIAVNSVLSFRLIYSVVSSHKQVKQLEDIVYIDPLTNIYNRVRLFIDGENLIKKKIPFRLIYMDLDHFKDINDIYGHMTGDNYLIYFSQQINRLLKADDCLYRMSGDEFVILNQSGDQSLPERLGQCIEKVTVGQNEIPFLGVSVGWAAYPLDDSTLDSLLMTADKQMYCDKNSSKSSSNYRDCGFLNKESGLIRDEAAWRMN